MVVLAVSNILFGTVSFVISACLVKIQRLRHLVIVGTFAWLIGLFNIFLGMASFAQWFFGVVAIAFMVLLGRAISSLFIPAAKAEVH